MDYCHYFLPLYDPNNFPKKVLISSPLEPSKSRTYIERTDAYAMVQMLDDDFTVGNCHCSNCNASIDPFDKFCRACGSKIKGRYAGVTISTD